MFTAELISQLMELLLSVQASHVYDDSVDAGHSLNGAASFDQRFLGFACLPVPAVLRSNIDWLHNIRSLQPCLTSCLSI